MSNRLSAQTLSEEAQIKKGDRIVFLGDSITQAGARPKGYVSLIRNGIDEMLGKEEATVIGAGISGHKVPDCQKRLERDVLDKKPTLVVIYIGINDVWHSTRGQGTPIDQFESGLRDMIQKIKAIDAKVILCTPSVIGEMTNGKNRLDTMLDQYADIGRKIAKETEVELLDLRALFLERLKKINPDQKPHSILTTDGVHLNADGNLFVAACVANAIGVSIDDHTDQVLRHLVMFKFKKEATKDEIANIVETFSKLPKTINVIDKFEAGTDVSAENRAKGFTHCFMLTFKTKADLAAYLPHPGHKKFVELLTPVIDDILVFDYWADN